MRRSSTRSSRRSGGHAASAGFTAVLEVSSSLPWSLLRRLVTAGYAASRDRPVLLVLSPDLREMVDRLLDESVRDVGIDVAGVRYAELVHDEPEILAIAAAAPLVLASTETFQSSLARHQIRYSPLGWNTSFSEKAKRSANGAPRASVASASGG